MNRLGLCLAFCVSLATAGFLHAAAFAQKQETSGCEAKRLKMHIATISE